MSEKFDGNKVRDHLDWICRQIDEHGLSEAVRKMAIVMALPAASLVSACDPPVMLYGVPEYGGPFEEYDCMDGYDDDSDGLTDCEDPDCDVIERCLGCFDGLDNDNNQLADCSDPTCQEGEGCMGCSDDADNDSDGLIDCHDPDCAGSPDCA